MTPKENKQLKELLPGEGFNYGGYRWTVLEKGADGKTLAITSEIVHEKAFDEGNRNDWRKSSLRKYLNENAAGIYHKMLANGANPEAFNLITSDLTSDDGIRDYGTAEDYIALISADQYRKYRALIPAVDSPWWTLTPWYIDRDNASYSHYVRLVYTTGTLNGNYAYYGNRGVRPICNLKSEIYVSTEEPEPEEEADTRKYTVCAECGEELGDEYYTYEDNHLQRDYFDYPDGSDNAYCSEHCAAEALMLECRDNVREG